MNKNKLQDLLKKHDEKATATEDAQIRWLRLFIQSDEFKQLPDTIFFDDFKQFVELRQRHFLMTDLQRHYGLGLDKPIKKSELDAKLAKQTSWFRKDSEELAQLRQFLRSDPIRSLKADAEITEKDVQLYFKNKQQHFGKLFSPDYMLSDTPSANLFLDFMSGNHPDFAASMMSNNMHMSLFPEIGKLSDPKTRMKLTRLSRDKKGLLVELEQKLQRHFPNQYAALKQKAQKIAENPPPPDQIFHVSLVSVIPPQADAKLIERTAKDDRKTITIDYKNEFRECEKVFYKNLNKTQKEIMYLTKENDADALFNLLNSLKSEYITLDFFQTANNKDALHWAAKLNHQAILDVMYKIFQNNFKDALDIGKETFPDRPRPPRGTKLLRFFLLDYAALCRQPVELLNRLIQAKTPVDADVYGLTALHFAASQGYTEGVNTLLSHKANTEAKTAAMKYTPLMQAITSGFTETARVLLNHKADIQTKFEDFSILHIAVFNAPTDTVAMLLDHKADIDLQTKYGDTPLISAVLNKKEETAKLLLDKGANASLTLSSGRTAFEVAFSPTIKKVILKKQLEEFLENLLSTSSSRKEDIAITRQLLECLNGRLLFHTLTLPSDANPTLQKLYQRLKTIAESEPNWEKRLRTHLPGRKKNPR